MTIESIEAEIKAIDNEMVITNYALIGGLSLVEYNSAISRLLNKKHRLLIVLHNLQEVVYYG